MLGVLWTVLFSLAAALAGGVLIAPWTSHLDPAERLGLSGLVGLATVGLLTLLVGLLPGGLTFALYVVLPSLAVGTVMALRNKALLQFSFKRSANDALPFAVLVVIGLLAFFAALAPSNGTDWDTIAYHLAVPKLWLAHGQIDYVQGIHHSNFPSTVEMLFVWGLKWGGQQGAKAFSLMVYVFGCLALFGLARRWYSRSAGWWAAVAFAGIPVVAWESGTGYIDVAHGLFCALGAVYAADWFRSQEVKGSLVLSGIALGFALGTKYTGLQMLFATVAVVGVAAWLAFGIKKTIASKLTVALLALAIGAPWYIKTAVFTGNPVYPFFFSKLGGKDWDAWRASIYTAEQKSFGVGSSPTKIGHAILGLGYQPGRYTNPRQDQGGGFPTGAIGFAALLAGVCAATCGRLRKEERLLLAIVGLGFLMWFFLSQQSRYLTMLAIPLCVLGAGQVSRVRWGPVVAGAFALQAAVTVYLVNTMQTQMQLQVVSGKVSREEYLRQTMAPFYEATLDMNALPAGSRVALYDEVFGFYLDVDYFWANPGHSMLVPYEGMSDAMSYVEALRSLGFTHVYANLVGQDRRYVEALTRGAPYTQEERAALMPDLNSRWHVLLSEAVQQGLIQEQKSYRGAVLYRVVR